MNERDILQIEFLKDHIVTPMVEALKHEVQPIVDAAGKHEARITALEKNQRRALTGYTAFVAVISSGLSIGAAQLKSWFNRKVSGR